MAATFSVSAFAQVSVTTYHNDIARSGLNSGEKILNPSNVNSKSFGLLFTLPVDGNVFAQPLYLPNLSIPGKGTHNVLFIATEHNSVYAFDADSNQGSNATPLWHVNLGPSVPAVDMHNPLISTEQGITATPVIVNSANPILYVVSFTRTLGSTGTPTYTYSLHALSANAGTEQLGGPTKIQASVPGNGDGSVKGAVAFVPRLQLCRTGLLYVPNSGNIYFGFGSQNDLYGYHGWLFGYSSTTLKQVGAFNTGPNSKTDPSGYPLAGGGVWQGGSGAASDGSNIYFSTGNGWFQPSIGSYGDSIIRLKDGQFSVADYFTPYNQETLDDFDTDVGAGGVLLLPSSVNAVGGPNLMVQMGKAGTIHLLSVSNMGKYGATDNVVQEIPKQGTLIGAPAYFNGTVYFGMSLGTINSFPISGGKFVSTTPSSKSTISYQVTGGAIPSISSNENSNGIVWAIQGNYNVVGPPGALQAYDAQNLGKLLYNSALTNGRDDLPHALKFTTPTIANGKVYVGTAQSVGVFGQGTWPEPPSLSEPSGIYDNPIRVAVAESTPGTLMTYTTDGTMPTRTSTRYRGEVALNASATMRVRAFNASGAGSTVAEANYLINPYRGYGDGLTGRYYDENGQLKATRIDPKINFDWKQLGIAEGFWSAQWTGAIQAETTGWHVISIATEDSVQVSIGNQMVVDYSAYTQTPSKNGKVYLVAGERVPVRIELAHNGGDSGLQLFWSGPGIATQLVPTQQVYSK